MTKVGISACLGYEKWRYDCGMFKVEEQEAKLFLEKQNIKNPEFIPVCPEQFGGMHTPRIPCEIQGGSGKEVWAGQAKVVSQNGEDVTKQFKLGALKALNIAITNEIEVFILKERSPSCGSNSIYAGDFNGAKKSGEGVTTALLRMCGIKVFSEDEVFSKVEN